MSAAKESPLIQRLTCRAASLQDAAILLELANDQSVRANSFSSDPIPQEQHLKWCLEKLSSDATRIWIMELDGAVIGQIRYDRTDPETAEIDFTVAPAYRGQGVGTSTLVLTCRSACDELGVTRLVGVVLESNVSSARAFQKAGFRQLAAGREVQGRRCSIFEWRSERGG